ncbi:DUF6884 domain-containing protein [Deinococcus fonticola]|uniref:DUF6884 domain-containing protein n=1 Tax=Deinococcus fonticola TaxID=2528713 RepID=UPI0010752B3B|nr:DUF6884 domain-containing protein [Deinococcus fonticola]
MQNHPHTLVLVGCVKKKQASAALAEQLYTSPLFRKRAAFAKHFGDDWLILSALHGVVSPQQELAPYDVTLNTLGKAERRQWAKQVMAQLEPHLPGVGQVILLAGARYSEFLIAPLEGRGLTVSLPLKNMQGVGPQQTWLAQAVRSGSWSA